MSSSNKTSRGAHGTEYPSKGVSSSASASSPDTLTQHQHFFSVMKTEFALFIFQRSSGKIVCDETTIACGYNHCTKFTSCGSSLKVFPYLLFHNHLIHR